MNRNKDKDGGWFGPPVSAGPSGGRGGLVCLSIPPRRELPSTLLLLVSSSSSIPRKEEMAATAASFCQQTKTMQRWRDRGNRKKKKSHAILGDAAPPTYLSHGQDILLILFVSRHYLPFNSIPLFFSYPPARRQGQSLVYIHAPPPRPPATRGPPRRRLPEMENGHAKYRVAVIGSGNWGSVASRLIASNTAKLPSFYDEVRMWVFEEILPTGKKLSESINEQNENCKYLPGIKLGTNVVADPDLESAVKDANMLVFVTPHQFVEGICKKLVGKLRPGAEAISLIKGMEVKMEGPCMISKLIADTLGINCCVLMGANIANEIAVEEFSEATIGYRKDKEVANRWANLFTTPYFLVSVAEDIEGVELCGTLKNIVAIAAGLVDGLNMGNNTKAAIMRIGLREMRAFSKLLFPSVKDNTFFESCGVADLITTCLGGRNRRVAEAFARNGGKRSFDELEAEMLHGQKLQGVSTAREVYEVLTYRGWQELFPLLSTVHEICIGQLPPTSIVEYSEHTPNLSIIGGPTPFY